VELTGRTVTLLGASGLGCSINGATVKAIQLDPSTVACPVRRSGCHARAC